MFEDLKAAVHAAAVAACNGDADAAKALIDFYESCIGAGVVDDEGGRLLAAAIHTLRPIAGYSLQ